MPAQFAEVVPSVVVAVDVGKRSAALSVTSHDRIRLLGPVEFAMTRPALQAVVERIAAVLPAGAAVRVGVEAAGHYHLPVCSPGVWPAGWELVALNPAHVAEQRRAQGRRRVKTDALDLEAITELLLAGRGRPVGDADQILRELAAWTTHRARRVHTRVATKNQLLAQLDRSFPGLTLALPDVLGTKVGRLVASEFADPARLAAFGVARFVRFAAARDLTVRRPMAERLVRAAGDALPCADAVAARRVLATDLALLAFLDRQIIEAETELERLVPASPFRTLTSVPGWAVIRVARYGAALGDPTQWRGAAQVYRASGLSPAQHESARRRYDYGISREGSVTLRYALIDLGFGLRSDPATRAYLATLKARGKPGGVIACALAHRANRIAFALVRDQTSYDPARWNNPS